MRQKIRFEEQILNQTFMLILQACFVVILAVIAFGCATSKLPAVLTYAEAKKRVDAQGSLITPPVEKRKGLKPGTAKKLEKATPAPYKGLLLDRDAAAYYPAVEAERNRRRTELEAERKKSAIQKLIYESTIDHLRALAKKQSTWWERNRGLVGFSIGVAIGMGIVVGLLYAITKGQGMNTGSSSSAIMLPPGRR
jgi:hypothetical protein